MKNLIFGFVIAILLINIIAMKQQEEPPAPVYNKINNKELIKAIEEFVEKTKGSKSDLNSKFLQLIETKRQDGSYYVDIYYMPDHLHNLFIKQPMIICAPVAGKKIFIESCSWNYFIGPNRPEVGLYFKDDCPKVYLEFLEETKYDSRRPVNLCPDSYILHDGYLLVLFDKDDNLKNKQFHEMNRIKQ